MQRISTEGAITILKAGALDDLAYTVRSLGPRARPLEDASGILALVHKEQPGAARPRLRLRSRGGQEAQPGAAEREASAFVAFHRRAAIGAAALGDRQLPPASLETAPASSQHAAHEEGSSVRSMPMASSADRAEYANEAERLRRLVQRLVERVLTERHNVAQAARAQIVELAMVIAERVVRRVAECDHSIAARAVAEALTHVQSRERVRVRLNPRDLQYVQTVDAQTAAGFAAIERLELVQDADVGVGGCVVETDMGSIDGRVETQLAQIEQALLAALRTGRVDEPQ